MGDQPKVYDVVIIGAGPAGLTAGLYAGRARMSTLILERGLPGGQMQNTYDIENYPGFGSVTGAELSERMREQAERFGAELVTAEVLAADLRARPKRIDTSAGTFLAHSAILAVGVTPKRLGVPGEERLAGRGVSYCATCDGAFFRDLPVVVVGGGDSAFDEALFLTRHAARVTIVHRRDSFRAAKVLQEKARPHPKIEFVLDSVVEEIVGDRRVEAVRLRNLKTGREQLLEARGVFIYVGLVPQTEILRDQVELDEWGYIVTDERMRTGVPGVFAAGDARPKFLRQLVTATADGAIAAVGAEKYVEDLRDPSAGGGGAPWEGAGWLWS